MMGCELLDNVLHKVGLGKGLGPQKRDLEVGASLACPTVDNTIPIASNRVPIQKTHFGYQKRHNSNLDILSPRDPFAESVVF